MKWWTRFITFAAACLVGVSVVQLERTVIWFCKTYPSTSSTPLRPYRLGGCDRDRDDRPAYLRVIGNRDLQLYDNGGRYLGGGYNQKEELPANTGSLRSAREFIWKHWQQKKRAYVVVSTRSRDSGSDAHVFVEPGDNGD